MDYTHTLYIYSYLFIHGIKYDFYDSHIYKNLSDKDLLKSEILNQQFVLDQKFTFLNFQFLAGP